MKKWLFFLFLMLLGSPARAAEPAKALTELETRYAEDRAVSLRLVLARYADDLVRLQSKMVQAGDTAGAARVQLERDRIMPALGLPVVPEGEADEFAVFDEAPTNPALPLTAPPVPPRDMDELLKTLMPAAPVAAPAQPALGGAVTTTAPTSGGRASRRVLRMANASLLGSYDPVYGYVYWSAGRSASWTVNDLPPGTYQLRLRYTCDSKEGGGKLSVKFGAETREADIVPLGNWKRKNDVTVGPFVVKESRADLVLQPVSIKLGASYLMDLVAVAVQPVEAAAGP